MEPQAGPLCPAEIATYILKDIGHASNGKKYTPNNVLEPFAWLIYETEPALAELIGLENPNV